ncbi:hypothetical protein Vretifemale_13718 [Volvox reticuliferus]|uniref:Uncharacterized protein n=1 Tax=Volvox reticuliferus TaxID=1737510 RepID=A0A8J4FPP7_9CHLO|nr:hypothetical protein Vretifemale_13718 [Volvox reticuliferus]
MLPLLMSRPPPPPPVHIRTRSASNKTSTSTLTSLPRPRSSCSMSLLPPLPLLPAACMDLTAAWAAGSGTAATEDTRHSILEALTSSSTRGGGGSAIVDVDVVAVAVAVSPGPQVHVTCGTRGAGRGNPDGPDIATEALRLRAALAEAASWCNARSKSPALPLLSKLQPVERRRLLLLLVRTRPRCASGRGPVSAATAAMSSGCDGGADGRKEEIEVSVRGPVCGQCQSPCDARGREAGEVAVDSNVLRSIGTGVEIWVGVETVVLGEDQPWRSVKRKNRALFLTIK